jgi:hypothetical protein
MEAAPAGENWTVQITVDTHTLPHTDFALEFIGVFTSKGLRRGRTNTFVYSPETTK